MLEVLKYYAGMLNKSKRTCLSVKIGKIRKITEAAVAIFICWFVYILTFAKELVRTVKKYKVLSNLLSFNNQILGNKPRGVVSVHLEYSASANKWLACVWTAVSTDSRSGRAMIRTRVTSHTVYYYLRQSWQKYLVKYCSKIYFWMFLAAKVLVYY